MAFHLPLDFQYWFLNVMAGTTDIFLGICLLFLGIGSAKFGFPNVVTFSAFALFILMLSSSFTGLPILVILIIGLIIGFLLSRIWK